MIVFYCNGKKDYCNKLPCLGEKCEHYDGTGGQPAPSNAGKECSNCDHRPVCGKFRATGGHVRECEHHADQKFRLLIAQLDAERPAHPETPYDIGYNNGLTMAMAIAKKMDGDKP